MKTRRIDSGGEGWYLEATRAEVGRSKGPTSAIREGGRLRFRNGFRGEFSIQDIADRRSDLIIQDTCGVAEFLPTI